MLLLTVVCACVLVGWSLGDWWVHRGELDYQAVAPLVAVNAVVLLAVAASVVVELAA